MPTLKHTDIAVLDEAMNTGQGAGYVLNFSDRTFAFFFNDEFGIDIDHEKYRENGTSKGKRLRTLLTIEPGMIAARVMKALWDQRASILEGQGSEEHAGLSRKYFDIVHRLQGAVPTPNTDGIDRFSQDETLDELISSILRDIGVNKPQASLDRLHTYCMKKFAHLIGARGGRCDQETPLHSRAGTYIKLLESTTSIQPISMRIMKSSISIFEEFNNVRNNRSLAHDNELVGLNEARFIFDSISNVLRFIRSVEASRFGG